MHIGIRLIYLDGEMKGGRYTGRTILVIETTCPLDPTSPAYSSAEIERVVSSACYEWEKRYVPTDLVRLERHSDEFPLPFGVSEIGAAMVRPRYAAAR